MYSLLSSTVAPDLASTSSTSKGDFIALHPEPSTNDTERKGIRLNGLSRIFLIFISIFSFCSSGYSQCQQNPNCTGYVPPAPGTYYFVPPGSVASVWQAINLLGSPDFIGADVLFNGNYTIDVSLSIINCKVKIAPGSQITVNPGVTLTIDNSCLSSSATSTWTGLYLSGSNSNLFMTNSTLQDAEIGINAQPFSHFELRGGNVMFNNVDHVVIEPWNNTVSNVVYGTCFTSTALLTNTIGYTQSRYGINFKATTPISIMPINTFMTVGDPLYAQNVFEFCENGIFATGWNLTVHNNTFRFINPTGPITVGKYTGIWYNSIASPRPGQWRVDIVGAFGTTIPNRFEDSYRGIQVNNNGVNLTIYRNNFLRCTKDGVLVKNSWESDFYISENTFLDVALSSTPTKARAAILLDDLCNLYRPSIEVFRNVITTSMPNAYFNYTENSGIHVGTTCDSSRFYYIYANEISGKRAGIYVNGSANAVVECNIVNLATVPYDASQTAANVVSVGIDNNNSVRTLIIRNNIAGTGTVGSFLPQSTGILSSSSIEPKISCNNTTAMLNHIESRGNCVLSEIQFNDFFDGSRGIYMNGVTAWISDQGTPTWPAYNTWGGAWTGCVSTNGWLNTRSNSAGHNYYCLSMASHNPTACNSFSGPGFPFNPPIITFPIHLACEECTGKPYEYARYLYDEDTGLDTIFDGEEGAQRIASGNIDYSGFSYDLQWWNEWGLIYLLEARNNINEKPEFVAFLEKPENQSKVASVRALLNLHSNSLELTVNYNSQINDSHSYAMSLNTYISTMVEIITSESEEITDAHYSTLLELATSCPEEKGPAVFLARAAIEKYKEEYPISTCEVEEEENQKLISNKANPISEIRVNVSNEYVTISGIDSEENFHLSLVNINGLEVFSYTGNNQKIELPELPVGLYIYHISTSSLVEVSYGKIIIVK
jgi:hypothetical protein